MFFSGRFSRFGGGALLSLMMLCMGIMSSSFAAEEPGLGPTLTKIRDRGYIYIGHRTASLPFSYVLPGAVGSSTVTGYTWEICGHVVKAIEGALGKSVQIVPVATSQNNRLMLVKTGMVDMECGATTNMSGRQKLAAFSNTYFVSEVKLLTKADSTVRAVADLANRQVVAVMGSTAIRLLRQAAFVRGFSVNIQEARTAEEAMLLLQGGKVDAFAGDESVLNEQRAVSPQGGAFAFLVEGLSVEPYGLVLPAEDENFRKLVNQTLVGLMSSGELERLYLKWFMGPLAPNGINLNMPMSPMMKSVIEYPNDRPATY